MLKKPASDIAIEAHAEINDTEFIPSRYEFLRRHKGIRPNTLHGMIGSTGCLSGDTVIRVNRNGNSKKYSLKELCIKFGKYPGSKRTFVDIKSNRIRSYIKDENRIGLNEFINVTYSGIKKTYTMVLEDGKSIRCTAEHEIQTEKGMIQLKDLSIGEMVMVDKNVLPVKSVEKHKKTYDLHFAVGVFHPYTKSFTSRGQNLRRIEKHRCINEASLNNLSVIDFQEATKMPNSLKYIDPSIYDIHHIDFDHYNNSIDNLVALEKREHRLLHSEKGKHHFSQGIISYSAIKLIELFGNEETFDVHEVINTHNFCANDIVVSNCGKSTLLKCIIAETASTIKILIWLSEETVLEYQKLLNDIDKSMIKNIVFVEERSVPEDTKNDQDLFLQYFEQMVVDSGCCVVFIDNVTTSVLYNSRFGFFGQNKTADFLSNFVKRVCSIFYISHTGQQVTDNYNKIVTPEDMRGSKELALVTEYFYIIQKFTSNGGVYTILRNAKYRHHREAAGYFNLVFEKGYYIGDGYVPFEMINYIFKSRDHLGRKTPKKLDAKDIKDAKDTEKESKDPAGTQKPLL